MTSKKKPKKKRLRKIMKERFDIDKKDIEFVPLSHQ